MLHETPATPFEYYARDDLVEHMHGESELQTI